MRRLSSFAHIWTKGLGVITLVLFLLLVLRVAIPMLPWLQRPTVQMISPSDGDTDILSRRSIDITFNQPMNRRSVEQALTIAPPTAGTLEWSADARVVRFLPQTSLAAGVTYTVQLDTSALGRWWQPLDQPVHMAFQTARSPTVVSALPDHPAVSPDMPIVLLFSQPMVPADQIGLPVDFAFMQIEPPVKGEARWINSATLLFRPDQPFLPDTHYRATLQPLADLRGIDLDQPFSWDWTTQGGTLLDHAPAANDRLVAPRQPLVMTFLHPFAIDSFAQRLVITPTITGELTATTQLSGTQVVTFTPTIEWQPEHTYTVSVALDTHADQQNLPGVPTLPPHITWRFTTAPQPALAGRFPGQGQLLPHGQSVRLIFRTPMDATALKAGLTLDPPVNDVQVRVNDTEVRLLADWQPSTAYTLTLAADIVDRNGTPLAQEYRLSFLTESAPPALQVSDLVGHVIRMPTDQPTTLTIDHTNLSALDLSLYALDETTLLRTLGFGAEEWRAFQPERYQQSFLRSWRVPLNDPLDRLVQEQLPIGTPDRSTLAAGSYYLLVRSPEGARADVILVVSDVELIMKQSQQQVLVWATDRQSGDPVAGLPLTLYRGDDVVAQSQTNGDGVWQIRHQRRSDALPYLVVADGPRPAIVSSTWHVRTNADSASAAEYQVLLVTNRPTYAPGEIIHVGGYVRQVSPDGSLVLPATSAELELTLQPVQARNQPNASPSRISLSDSGVVSGSLVLDAQILPGQYLLQGKVEQTSVQVPVSVVALEAPLQVLFDDPQVDINNRNRPVMLPVEISSADLPVVGAQVSWNSRAVPVTGDRPVRSDAFAAFQFGSPAPITAEPLVQAGSGQSDADGRLMLPLASLATLTQTLQYEISVTVVEPGGLTHQASTMTTVAPAGPHVGIRLPTRLITVADRAVVEVVALDADAAPVANVRIDVDLFRREWLPAVSATGYLEAQDTLVLTRQTLTDDQGNVEVQFPLLSAGEYYLVARADQQQSSAALWVTALGYTNWSDEGQQVALVADRDVYRVGETARLLVAMPSPQAFVLLTREQGDQLAADVYALRAGQILEVDITSDMAPTIDIGVLVAAASNGSSPLIRSGSTRLRILDARPVLTTMLELDQPSYQPGATATVRITTSDETGRGVPATLLLAVTGYTDDLSGAVVPRPLPLSFNPARPSRFSTAASSLVRTTFTRPDPVVLRTNIYPTNAALSARPSRAVYWNTHVRTGRDGTLVVQIPLPPEAGIWHMQAYAAQEATLFSDAYARLAALPPLLIEPALPATLRVGDTTRVMLHVRNTSPISQEVRATVTAVGLTILDNPDPTQIQSIAPGTVQTFTWNIRADTTATAHASLSTSATLQFAAEPSVGERVTRSVALALAPGMATSVTTHTLEMTSPLSRELELTSFAVGEHAPLNCGNPPELCRWATLELAVAPDIRAAITDSAIALLALSPRTVEQEASLLLLSAALAGPGEQEAAFWREQVRRSRAVLDAAQSDTGGWGWWPDSPAHPFFTGYVLEAQATANAVLADMREPAPQALTFLRQADHPDADPNLRAYIQYVLLLLGEGNLADARALLDLDLQADGLAYLALALPSAESNQPLTRLLDLAQSARGQDATRLIYWQVQGDAPLARDMVSTTALVVQAFQRQNPDAPQIAPALRALRLAWGVDGWSTAYGGARAAPVLLAGMARSDPVGVQGYQVSVNGQTILSSDQLLERTQHRLVASQQLLARNILRMTPARSADATSPALLAYRLREQVAADPTHTDALAVYQEYLDPLTDTPLTAQILHPGQLIRVRLTLAALQPMAFVTLESGLPAAFVPLSIEDGFVSFTGTMHPDRISLLVTNVKTGVYTQTYLVRVVHIGSFAVPPPVAAPAYTPDHAARGLSGRIDVAWP